MKLLISIICVLVLNSTLFAQFRLFSPRQQSGGCANGNCQMPSYTYKSVVTQSVPQYTLRSIPQTVVQQPVVVLPPPIQVVKSPESKLIEVLPKELTINGIKYFRH